MQMMKLNNGVEIPMEGFGVFQMPNPAECEQAVLDALEAGYRMIDTAAAYLNEAAVGAAIRRNGIPRSDLFITTKVWVQDAGYEKTKLAFASSMEKLGLDYLDLYLIHQPFGDYYGAWRAMEELYAEGKVRAIGVSNFYPDRLVDLCLNAKVIPAVNQVELHPFFQQEEAIAQMHELGVCPEAWGPLAEGKHGIFTNPELTAIAQKHQKSVAQVVLRWNAQRGVVIIPKSSKKARIAENLDVWDFSLTEDEMAAIAKMDLGHSEIADHHSVALVRALNARKLHD